jgi:UrcA family protein
MFKTNLFAAVAAAGFAFGAIAAATAPAPAFAKEVEVRYSDLNLSTPEGQKKLDRRIDTAARSACGLNTSTTGSRLRSADATDCYAKARENVRKQVAGAVDKADNGQHLAVGQ